MITPVAAPIDQAQPQSIEDRIAAQFDIIEDSPPGDDGAPIAPPEPTPEGNEAQPEDDAAAEPEPTEAEVEWQGAKYRVPKDLESAVLQANDYTRKTQEVANQRRQVEYAQQAVEATRQELEFGRTMQTEFQQLQGLDNHLAQLNQVNVDDLPFEEGIAHDRKVARLEKQRAALAQGIEAKRGEFAQKQRQTIETLKVQSRELLSKQYGGLDDKVFASLTEHAKTLGYSDQDVEMISLDPRAQSMLYKAWKYDQLQANKSAAVLKATTPTVKVGSSNPMPQQVREKLALRKAIKAEPNSAKRARLIEQDIANRFS